VKIAVIMDGFARLSAEALPEESESARITGSGFILSVKLKIDGRWAESGATFNGRKRAASDEASRGTRDHPATLNDRANNREKLAGLAYSYRTWVSSGAKKFCCRICSVQASLPAVPRLSLPLSICDTEAQPGRHGGLPLRDLLEAATFIVGQRACARSENALLPTSFSNRRCITSPTKRHNFVRTIGDQCIHSVAEQPSTVFSSIDSPHLHAEIVTMRC
jgi:hypothetical protein